MDAEDPARTVLKLNERIFRFAMRDQHAKELYRTKGVDPADAHHRRRASSGGVPRQAASADARAARCEGYRNRYGVERLTAVERPSNRRQNHGTSGVPPFDGRWCATGRSAPRGGWSASSPHRAHAGGSPTPVRRLRQEEKTPSKIGT